MAVATAIQSTRGNLVSEEQAEPKVDEYKFKAIGGLWKRPEGSKSIATGSITVNGRKVKVVVVQFARKHAEGAKVPDWTIKAEVPFDLDLGVAPPKSEEAGGREPSDSQEQE